MRVLSLELYRQSLHLLGYGREVVIGPDRCGLREPCLGRYQLSYQVYEDIQLFRWDPKARCVFVFRRRLLFYLSEMLLLYQRRFDRLRRHNAHIDQHLADILSLLQNRLQGIFGDVAPLEEDLAKPAVLFLKHVDPQLTHVLHKDEHVLYRIYTLVRGDDKVPRDVAVFWVDMLKKRDLIDLGGGRAFAQVTKLVEKKQWIGAGEKDVGRRLEAYTVANTFARRYVYDLYGGYGGDGEAPVEENGGINSLKAATVWHSTAFSGASPSSIIFIRSLDFRVRSIRPFVTGISRLRTLS